MYFTFLLLLLFYGCPSLPSLITFDWPSKQWTLTRVHFERAPLQRRLCDWESCKSSYSIPNAQTPSPTCCSCCLSTCPFDTHASIHGPFSVHVFDCLLAAYEFVSMCLVELFLGWDCWMSCSGLWAFWAAFFGFSPPRPYDDDSPNLS